MADHRPRKAPRLLKPPERFVRHVRFDAKVLHLRHHKGVIEVTGNPVLNTLTDPTVTSSPLLVTNTTTGATTMLDMINPAVTFTCNPGDTGTVTPQGDINPAGQGPAGAAFTWTAPDGYSASSAIAWSANSADGQLHSLIQWGRKPALVNKAKALYRPRWRVGPSN